jgi:hypothetical protein
MSSRDVCQRASVDSLSINQSIGMASKETTAFAYSEPCIDLTLAKTSLVAFVIVAREAGCLSLNKSAKRLIP